MGAKERSRLQLCGRGVKRQSVCDDDNHVLVAVPVASSRRKDVVGDVGEGLRCVCGAGLVGHARHGIQRLPKCGIGGQAPS